MKKCVDTFCADDVTFDVIGTKLLTVFTSDNWNIPMQNTPA